MCPLVTERGTWGHIQPTRTHNYCGVPLRLLQSRDESISMQTHTAAMQTHTGVFAASPSLSDPATTSSSSHSDSRVPVSAIYLETSCARNRSASSALTVALCSSKLSRAESISSMSFSTDLRVRGGRGQVERWPVSQMLGLGASNSKTPHHTHYSRISLQLPNFQERESDVFNGGTSVRRGACVVPHSHHSRSPTSRCIRGPLTGFPKGPPLEVSSVGPAKAMQRPSNDDYSECACTVRRQLVAVARGRRTRMACASQGSRGE